MSTSILSIRGRYARLCGLPDTDPAVLAEAKQDLIAANCEVAIRKALAEDPPLSLARRQALAALLVGGGDK